MKFYPTEEQQARLRSTKRRFAILNGVFCLCLLYAAFTTGFIPAFFAGGINGFVALLLWN